MLDTCGGAFFVTFFLAAAGAPFFTSFGLTPSVAFVVAVVVVVVAVVVAFAVADAAAAASCDPVSMPTCWLLACCACEPNGPESNPNSSSDGKTLGAALAMA